MVSISQQRSSLVISYSKQKKRDITSLLGQMCPPAATSASFGKLGPIVPSCAWWVVGTCELPVATIGRARLVMVDGASSLDGGHGLWFRESTRQWQRQWRWCGRLRGEGAFSSFRHLAGKGALAAAVAPVAFGHVRVVDGAVVPVIGVPLRQNAVSVMAVDVRSWAPVTPMSHSQAVETEPFCSCIRAHHVAWTTPSDDNCRRAVDST
jgi:hypothetical protein